MLPEVRAIADRLTWEGAIMRFLGEILPEDAPGRATRDPGWPVNEAFAHLARQEKLHADGLEYFLAGEPAYSPSRDHAAYQAETARLAAELPLDHWLDEAARQRARLYEMFGSIDDPLLARDFSAGRTLRQALHAWSGHYADHAFEIIDVVPEVVLEPILIRWLLHLDPGPDEAFAAKQRALAQRVRAALEALDEESGD